MHPNGAWTKQRNLNAMMAVSSSVNGRAAKRPQAVKRRRSGEMDRLVFMVLFIFEEVRHQESIGNCMGGSMNLFRKSVELTEVGRIPDFVINQAIQSEKRVLSIQQMSECCVICGIALHDIKGLVVESFRPE